MTQTCMIVRNSVLRDPRVMKEANSLRRAGYEVTVLGLTENLASDPAAGDAYTETDNGIRVHRMVRGARPGWLPKLPMNLASGIGFQRVVGDALLVVVLVFLGTRLLLGSAAQALGAWGQALRRPPASDVLLTLAVALCLVFRLSRQIDKVWRVLRRRLRNRLKSAMFRGFVKKKVREIDPIVVHCHDLSALPFGVACKRQRPKLKLIYDSHEIFEEQSLLSEPRRRKSRREQRRLSKHVDGFVTVNDAIAELLRQRYPRLPEATVVMNAVEHDGREPTDDGRLHEAAGLSPLTKVLLFHGGFAERRGLDHLVRAGKLLPKGWAIVLMGWGKFESRLRSIVDEDEQHNVRFVPPVPRQSLELWTAGATLGIIPYENCSLNHWYCSPNKIWEYAGAGVPILASPLFVIKEMIERNQIGFLLEDPVTPQNIADVVSGLTQETLDEKARNCREFIKRDNWSVYEQRLLALYERLRQPAPPGSR